MVVFAVTLLVEKSKGTNIYKTMSKTSTFPGTEKEQLNVLNKHERSITGDLKKRKSDSRPTMETRIT